ncbi:MAG: SDR family oxidoreductase [Planctomycetota bacterium]
MGDRLAGHGIVVTGAARGIGRAIAAACAREGGRVLLTDIRDDEGEAAAAEMGAAYCRLDVRSEDDWRDAFADAAARGIAVTGLVNNAGVSGFNEGLGPQDPEHCALADWRAVHATNLDGVFLGCRHAIGAMRAAGGSIVNIASRNATVGVGGAAPYASSKAAVLNHTRSVALYCAERGLPIRCNAVLPGAILTPIWDALLAGVADRDAAIADIAAEVPLKRMGAPADVAAMVVYLLRDESSYATGAAFAIDGGLTAGTTAQPQK